MNPSPLVSMYDALVIGAGQAGGPLAGALSRAGWKVALVEKAHAGGTCVNEGCTPTKTMIASGRVAHLARRAREYGVHVSEVTVNLHEVVQRKQAVVSAFRAGSAASLQRAGVEVLYGHAAFTGPREVRVTLNDGGERQLAASRVFINVGARPVWPDVPGLRDVGAVDSEQIMHLDHLPEHLLILGGGYIGLEFGQLFARLGSRVTIVEQDERLAPREDEDVAAALTEALEADGVSFVFQARASEARRLDDAVELVVEGPSGHRVLRGSHVLVAAGRQPNSDSLNLAAAGVQVNERGYVQVDGHLRTTAEGVHALGDVTGGPAFTHVSYDDYRIVRDQLLHGRERTTAGRLVPYAVFTDPQLARVGLSEQQARQGDRAVRVYTLPMTRVARAIETGETRGLMKAVVDDETDRIVGATVLGVEGGEVLSVLQMAMMGGVTAGAIRDGVFAHPTLAESLNNLFMSTPRQIAPDARPERLPA